MKLQVYVYSNISKTAMCVILYSWKQNNIPLSDGTPADS